MVRPRNGRNVARVIDGAHYVVVDGMGHDLPEPVWRPVVEALTRTYRRHFAKRACDRVHTDSEHHPDFETLQP